MVDRFFFQNKNQVNGHDHDIWSTDLRTIVYRRPNRGFRKKTILSASDFRKVIMIGKNKYRKNRTPQKSLRPAPRHGSSPDETVCLLCSQTDGNASAADGSDDRVDPAGGHAAGPADRVRRGRSTVSPGPGAAAHRRGHDPGLSDAPPVSGKTTPRTGAGVRVALVRSPTPPSPPPTPPAPRGLRGQRAVHTENGHLVIIRLRRRRRSRCRRRHRHRRRSLVRNRNLQRSLPRLCRSASRRFLLSFETIFRDVILPPFSRTTPPPPPPHTVPEFEVPFSRDNVSKIEYESARIIHYTVFRSRVFLVPLPSPAHCEYTIPLPTLSRAHRYLIIIIIFFL